MTNIVVVIIVLSLLVILFFMCNPRMESKDAQIRKVSVEKVFLNSAIMQGYMECSVCQNLPKMYK